MAESGIGGDRQFALLTLVLQAVCVVLFGMFADYGVLLMPGGSYDPAYVNTKYPRKITRLPHVAYSKSFSVRRRPRNDLHRLRILNDVRSLGPFYPGLDRFMSRGIGRGP